LFTPYDPHKIIETPLEKPNGNHVLGTNDLGQDIFSRLLYGTRATLLIGFIDALVSISIGTFIGTVSGYYGGKIDEFITRAIDVLMAIPMFPLLLVLVIFLTPSMLVISILMGILGWAGLARIIRSQVLSLSESNFVYGIRAIGATDPTLCSNIFFQMFCHWWS
jgi:ABC-type dipeptide/oligopeptide/nickel transport system permease subunit